MWARQLIGPGVFAAVEVPAPIESDIAPGGVLLRTLAGGICGSDIPKFQGVKGATGPAGGGFRSGRPGFPMHEVVGEVVSSRHRDIRPGIQVVGWASESNALAEYVLTDGEQLNTYDSSFDPLSAVLIQSIACVLFALERVSVSGKTVAVLGVGPIGALFAHVAKEQGAIRVTGVDPVDRRSMSSVLGFDETIQATSGDWSQHVRESDRPQVVIEAVGHQTETLNHALAGARPGGTVLYFGIPDVDVYPVNVELLMRKNLQLLGGITRDRRRSLARAGRYLRDHPELYGALVTHEFERLSIEDAFDVASRPAPDRMKVVVSLA